MPVMARLAGSVRRSRRKPPRKQILALLGVCVTRIGKDPFSRHWILKTLFNFIKHSARSIK